jgi:hypothetical protein
MVSDQETRGGRFPAYAEDPLRETRLAIEALRTDPSYAEAFATFQRDMVYGDHANYEECMESITEIGKLVLEG